MFGKVVREFVDRLQTVVTGGADRWTPSRAHGSGTINEVTKRIYRRYLTVVVREDLIIPPRREKLDRRRTSRPSPAHPPSLPRTLPSLPAHRNHRGTQSVKSRRKSRNTSRAVEITVSVESAGKSQAAETASFPPPPSVAPLPDHVVQSAGITHEASRQ